ncbi:hypothetical protein [Lysinibacillus sp. NPDC092081]|uniref:hypothetical protein n=1 Tax=Lysinibacillus sp. NPDC092081 TaxID=3364131 RepID=UPI0038163F33
MENTIKVAFDEILDEQIHQIAYRKCINDHEYRIANTKAITLMDMLKRALSNDEQRIILNDLENAFYIAESIFLEYCYRQGIEDSQMIHKKLSVLMLQK